VSDFWTFDPRFDSSWILNFPGMLRAHAIVDIILDTLVILLPVRVIGSLNLTLKKKITVGGIFLMGGL
jgi:hypothetical protein